MRPAWVQLYKSFVAQLLHRTMGETIFGQYYSAAGIFLMDLQHLI
jgi:hypothetical protein